MAKTIRAFWAITPPSEIIENIIATLAPALKKTFGDKLRFVPAKNMHITLKFMGDVEERTLRMMAEEMRLLAASTEPFGLRLRALGAFPSWRRTRVIWVGAESVPEPLLSLHGHSEIITAEHDGVASDDKRYHPHLTVARTRGVLEIKDMEAAEWRNFSSDEFTINCVELFASALTSNGAVYSLIERCPLQGARQ